MFGEVSPRTEEEDESKKGVVESPSLTSCASIHSIVFIALSACKQTARFTFESPSAVATELSRYTY